MVSPALQSVEHKAWRVEHCKGRMCGPIAGEWVGGLQVTQHLRRSVNTHADAATQPCKFLLWFLVPKAQMNTACQLAAGAPVCK